jgi:hypothetical protein
LTISANTIYTKERKKQITDLVEEILHLPLPDVTREIPHVDRPAPPPAHPPSRGKSATGGAAALGDLGFGLGGSHGEEEGRGGGEEGL